MKVLLRLADALSHVILISFMVLVILAAIVTSLLRYYLPQLDQYKQPVFEWLEQQSGWHVEAQSVSARWSTFKPDVSLTGVVIRHQQLQRMITLDTLRFEINLVKSAFYRRWHFDYLEIASLDVMLQQDEQRSWQMRSQRDVASPPLVLDDILAQVWAVDTLELSRLKLTLIPWRSDPVVLMDVSASVNSLFDRKQFVLTLSDEGQRRSRLTVDARGQPSDADFHADIHWQAKSLLLPGILPLFARVDMLSESRIDHELWLQWQQGRLTGTGSFFIDRLAWRSDQRSWTIDAPHGNMYVEGNLQQGLHFSIPQLVATINQQPLRLEKIKLHYERNLSLQMQQLDLAEAERYLRLLPLSPAISQLLDDLHPQGTLDNIFMQWHDNQDFTLQAYLHDISVGAWNNAPALTGVNGYLHAGKRQGLVALDSIDGFVMAFPNLFDEPMPFASANGVVKWRIGDGVVTVGSDVLQLTGAYGKATGLFDLYLPVDGRDKQQDPPRFGLMLSLVNGDAQYRNQLVPYTVDQGLRDWLDSAVNGGRLLQGSFIYHGPVTDDVAEEKTVQLWLDVEHGSIRYADGFPSLDQLRGEFLLDQQYGFARAEQAVSRSLSLQSASLRLWPGSDGRHIAIEADIDNAAAGVLNYLQQPALSAFTAGVLEPWKIHHGTLKAQLAIELALHDISAMKLSVDGRLDDVTLDLQPQSLQLEQVSGELDFSLDEGLASRGLQGLLWGQRVQAIIDSQVSGDDRHSVIQLAGQVDVGDLERWLALPVLKLASGKTAVTGELYWGSRHSGLTLQTALDGIAVDAPPPFAKQAGQSRQLTVSLPFSGESNELVVATDDGLTLSLRRGKETFDAGLLSFGMADKKYIEGTLLVNGNVLAVDVGQWLAVLRHYQALSPDNEAAERQRGLEPVLDGLNIRQLQAGDYRLENANLSAMQDPSGWLLQLRHSTLAGALLVRDDDLPWEADIEHIDLTLLTRSVANGNGMGASAAAAGTGSLPALAVSVRELRLDGESYGQWQFDWRPQQQGALLDNIQGFSRELRFGPQQTGESCRLQWQAGEQPVTAFRCQVTTDNAAAALQQWGYRQEVNSKHVTVNLDSHWPGGPGDFTLADSHTRFQLDMGKGNFADLSGSGTDALKALSVLNISSVLRRIQLDFSDLTNDGLAFDSVHGTGVIDQGRLTAEQPFVIKGAASQIRLAGMADLLNESLDMTMTVSLPLASNLPWVVALAAGLPAAAGVYIVSKFVEKQVDKISSVVYNVKGDFDEPTIRFRKLFDTGDDGQKSKGGQPAND